jgi:hypothetical protein
MKFSSHLRVAFFVDGCVIFFITLGGNFTKPPKPMKKITYLFTVFLLFSTLENWSQGVSSYAFSQSTEAYSAVIGTTSTATGDDGSENNIAIGFPFNYGGIVYNTFSINVNGWIRLGGAVGGQSWTNGLSNFNPDAPLIAPFWDDHNRTTGTIRYALVGISPDRKLEISWDNINLGNGGGTSPTQFGSFKLRLAETTGQIEFIYAPVMNLVGNLSASIGLNDTASFLSVTPQVAATANYTVANNAINSTEFLVGQKFTFTPQPPCSGMPNPGAVLTTANSVCASGNFTLTLENLTPGYGVTYQWSASTNPNASPYLPIPGANLPSYLGSQSVETSYACTVTCGGNVMASAPITITMNPLADCYCTPTYTNGKTDGDLISNVTITGTTLANNTGTDPVNPYYTYFTGEPNYTAELEAGVSYEMHVTVGTYENQNEAVWVDYNDDGIFTTNERVGFSSSIPANGTGIFTITLSCDAPLGMHRMRIRDVWNTAAGFIDPCANYGYGEVEDYDITITATTSCQIPINLTVHEVLSDTAELEWQGVCSQNNWDLHITPLGGGEPTGAPSNPNVNFQAAIAGLQPGTTYEAYVRANCDANGYSDWSAPVTFTTMAPAPDNDDCIGAVELTMGTTFEEHAVVGTNVSATKTTGVPGPSCATFGFGGDVWYTTIVPADGNVTLETQANTGSTLTDTVLMAFTGDCGNLTAIGCDDSNGVGDFSKLVLTGLEPNSRIYSRVWEYGNDAFGTFQVSAWSTTLQATDFENNSFKVYPNPVKDVLEISAKQPITSIEVYNLIGQQVIAKPFDANHAKVDMRTLPQGTYMVRVTVGSLTKTLKVIKE